MRTLFLISLVLLTSCRMMSVEKKPSLLTSTTESDLSSARDRLIKPFAGPSNGCPVRHCLGAAGCASLLALSGDRDKSDYLNGTLLSSSSVASWRVALQAAVLKISEAEGSGSSELEDADAYVSGNDIVVLRRRVTGFSSDRFLPLLAEQAYFLAGQKGTGRAGPFRESADAVTTAAACLVARLRAAEGLAPDLSLSAPIFQDTFEYSDVTNHTLSDRWRIVRGYFSILERDGRAWSFAQGTEASIGIAEIKDLSLRDLRLRARYEGRAVFLVRADEVGTQGYRFSIRGNSGSVSRISDAVEIGAGYSGQYSAPSALGTGSEAVVEIIGDRLRAFGNGNLLFDVRDAVFGQAGAVRFELTTDPTNNVDEIAVENLGGGL